MADTSTVGGVISGYCAIGNPLSAIRPAKVTMMDITEPNLGTRVAADGQIISRIVATQFTFVPRCIVLPANRPVTLRFATPDVIHGILVTGTNVNTMIVPGYVSQVHTVFTRTGDLLMPCHEYCGLGHSEMSATVRVVPPGDFKPDSQGGVSCDAR